MDDDADALRCECGRELAEYFGKRWERMWYERAKIEAEAQALRARNRSMLQACADLDELEDKIEELPWWKRKLCGL